MMKTVWKNLKWLVTGQILSRLIKGLVIISAARILSVEHFGAFNLASSIAAALMLINDWGLDALLTREAARGSQNEKNLIALFIVKTLLLALSVLAILFLGPFLAPTSLIKSLLPIIGISTLFDTLRDFHLSIARAQNRMDVDAKNNVIVNITTATAGIISLLIYKSIFLLAYAYLLGSFVGLMFTLFDVKTYYRRLHLYFDSHVTKQIIGEGAPLGLAILCITILLYADNIIIGWVLGPESVGLYAAPMKLIQLLYVGAALIANAYLPLMSQRIITSKKEFQTIADSSIQFSFLGGIAVALASFFLAPIIIPILLGETYLPSTYIFRILIASIPFVYTSTILGNLLLVANKQGAMVPFLIVGTGTNLLLNFLFIGKLGIEGAAIANIVSQAINFVGYYIVYTRYTFRT